MSDESVSTNKNITIGALILSGGKSRRMGRDKTTVEYRGETFLSRAVRFWKNVPGISKIYIGIGDEQHLASVLEDFRVRELFQDETVKPVFDLYPGCGPMAGLHAAFKAGDEDYLYVCAIDMLQMEASALMRPADPSADAFVYRENDNIEPLFALYSRRVLNPAEELLSSGRYKMQALLNSVNTVYIPINREFNSVFYNCNTPEDLSKADDQA